MTEHETGTSGAADKAPAVPATTTAWVREDYGPAEGTGATEVPTPRPGPGEVLLAVRATALNAGDVRLLLGDPLLVRPFFGLTRPRNPVRGIDVAGTVVALGDGVRDVAVGEEVVVELKGGGGLAGYAVAPADRLSRRPDGVDPTTAACLPVAAGTAWQAWDLAGIAASGPRAVEGPDAGGSGAEARGAEPGAGPRVLVIGASGGVGTFSVQLGVLRGAEVWASCGERSRALVEGLGAAHVVDHRAEGPGGAALDALPEGRFDAVIDIAGGIPIRRLQRLVRDGGRVVLVTGDGGRVLGPLPRMIRAAVLSIGSRRRALSLAVTPRPEVVEALLALAAEGRISPVIEREWAFSEAAEALAHVAAGHARGKNVVRAAS